MVIGKSIVMFTSLTGTMLQAIGRIFRLGQRRPQKIWIATVDHTYDQIVQSRAAKKMVSQIAGQGNVTMTDEEVQVKEDRKSGLDDDAVKAVITERRASTLYTMVFGQFDSRIDWNDVRDLTAKDVFVFLSVPIVRRAQSTSPDRDENQDLNNWI